VNDELDDRTARIRRLEELSADLLAAAARAEAAPAASAELAGEIARARHLARRYDLEAADLRRGHEEPVNRRARRRAGRRGRMTYVPPNERNPYA
jgi:hypothetical protein